jgi:hypothetical protein
MSEQKFEIAFSGQIVEGADLETVKQHIAKIFKADDAKLAQMFSGNRMLIKREVDEITMLKYRGAFQKAGAVCEIRELNDGASAVEPSAEPNAAPATVASAPPPAGGEEYVSRYAESELVPQALLTEPLGISGDQIEDLPADIAPVGSAMQDHYEEPAEPQIDTSGMDVAPVGATLDDGPDEEPPPPPDTSGLSILEP